MDEGLLVRVGGELLACSYVGPTPLRRDDRIHEILTVPARTVGR
jgi:hypothetical protein